MPQEPNSSASKLYLGIGTIADQQTPIYLTEPDCKGHFLVLGNQQSGKATFLVNLFLQNSLANKGGIYFDFKGDAIDHLKKELAKQSNKKIFVLDPLDQKSTVGFNVFSRKDQADELEITTELLTTIAWLFDPQASGLFTPTAEFLLRQLLLTVLATPNSNLLDVLKLLATPETYVNYLPNITNPLLKKYWETQTPKTFTAEVQTNLGYIFSKLERIIRSPQLRHLLVESAEPIDFDSILENQAILLVALPQQTLGDQTAKFLASSILIQLKLAAKRRYKFAQQDTRRATMPIFFTELSHFSPKTIQPVIAEAKAQNLELYLSANQITSLNQMLSATVFRTVANLFAFQMPPDQATFVCTKGYFQGVPAESLTKTALNSAWTKLLVDGKTTPTFLIATAEPRA